MNRELVKHNKFLTNEIRNLKAHIKKITNHLKLGENLYKKHRKKVPKSVILNHKKKVKNFKKQHDMYQNRLNDLINLRKQYNEMIRELQPSTSGRK